MTHLIDITDLENKEYIFGGYGRVSKEDGDLEDDKDESLVITDQKYKIESNSIANQESLIKNFFKSQPTLKLHKIYTDDGVSGFIYDRPGFLEMMEDLRNGTINAIVVKDISRFGRDYIENGMYLQRTFPNMGVRFISLLDTYDSITATSTEKNLVMPIKSFLADNYGRDLGMKIRSNQDAMRSRGLYISPHCGFGFRKSKENKHVVTVDAYSGKIVQNILTDLLMGYTQNAVCTKLNNLGVPTPSAYKKKSGIKHSTPFQIKDDPKWSNQMIKRIATNPMCMGTIIQGKTSRINHKVRKNISKPVSEYIVKKNAVKALISSYDFEILQDLLLRDLKIEKGQDKVYLLSGLLFCGDCGHALTRRKTSYKGKQTVFYICSSYNREKEKCSRHSVKEDDIKKVLLEIISKHILMLTDIEKLYYQYQDIEIDHKSLIVSSDDLAEKNQQLKEFEQLKSNLIRDLDDGVLSFDEYFELNKYYTDECKNLDSQISNIKKELNRIADKEKIDVGWIKQIKQYSSITEFCDEEHDRLMLIRLIDQIKIYENKHIEVVFRYKDELDRILKILDTVQLRAYEKKEVG